MADRSSKEIQVESGAQLTPEKIDEIAGLIPEFGLAEVEVSGPDYRIAFRKNRHVQVANVVGTSDAAEVASDDIDEPTQVSIPAAVGIPVTSPMTGIFYSRSNPSNPPFVSESAPVTAGQVVCLIEAMKVFNEITAPASGVIGRIGPKDGEVVQPGDVLLTILP